MTHKRQGLLGVVDQVSSSLHGSCIEFGVGNVRTNEIHLLGLELHQSRLSVLGEVQHHRTGTAAAGDVEGAAHSPCNILGTTNLIAPLGDWLSHTHEVNLLEEVRAKGRDWNLTSDDHDGSRVQHSISHARQGVGGPRTAGDDSYAHLAADAGIALSSVSGALFVAHEDMVEGFLLTTCIVV